MLNWECISMRTLLTVSALSLLLFSSVPQLAHAQAYYGGEENNKDLGNEIEKVRANLKKIDANATQKKPNSIFSEGQDHLDRLARAHVAESYFAMVDGKPRIALMAGQIEPSVLAHMIDDYAYAHHTDSDYIGDKALNDILRKNKEVWNAPGAAAARAANANSSLYMYKMPEGRTPGTLITINGGGAVDTSRAPQSAATQSAATSVKERTNTVVPLETGKAHDERMAREKVSQPYFNIVDGKPRIASMAGQIEPNVLEHMIDDYVYVNRYASDYIGDKALTDIIAKNLAVWNAPGAANARDANANSSLYITKMPEGRDAGTQLFVTGGVVNSNAKKKG